MTARSYSVTYEARPWTMNKDASGRTNRWDRGLRVAEWRGVFHLRALEAKIPKLDAVNVTITQELKNRQHMPDTCFGCAPAAKAALDGLVDAGILADDDPDHVRRISYDPPTVTGRDALTLTLTEVAP